MYRSCVDISWLFTERLDMQVKGKSFMAPSSCAAVKYKQMATKIHADPTAVGMAEIPPVPSGIGWISWKWIYDWFLYSSLCKNDFDSIDATEQPTTWETVLCCFSCCLLGKRKESTITIAFIIVFFFLTVAITAGILDTAGTGTAAGCADEQVMYCTASNCAPPVCPSIFAAPAPAPAPMF